MIVALVAVVLVAVAALAAQLHLAARHAAHTDALLARGDAERYAWARERWELNTRLQSPELVRMAPPAPPAQPGGADVEDDEDEGVDESHLVGTFAANPAADHGEVF